MLPHLQRLNALLAELKRRQVLRAVAVYAVAAWAVVEVTSTVLPILLLPDWVVRVVVGAVVLGFPVVIVLAWAFDLTLQGVERTPDDSSAPAATRQFLASAPFRATLVLLVLALTGAAGSISWHLWLRPGALDGADAGAPGERLDPTHLAVLYFDDFSQGGELEYLANGITEALIHELSQTGVLQVVSRNGVKPYRDLTIPLDSLARILRVGSIVEGSVEGSPERVGVTVQLVDGETNLHLLSERIQGTGDDVLALRDSIVGIAVRSVGQSLGRELETRRVRRGVANPEAWALFQEAQHLREDADTLRWSRGDTTSARRVLLRADSLLERASELDPSWPDPLVQRGWVLRTLAAIWSASATTRTEELLAVALDQAEAALGREPESTEALELRGTLRADRSRAASGEEAVELSTLGESDLRAAVERDGTRALAWVSLADILRRRGEFEEASVAAQHALEADPFLINAEKEILFTLSQVWLDLGDLERASRWTDEGRRRYPAEVSFSAAKLVILAGAASGPGAADTAAALLAEVTRGLGVEDWPLGRLQVAAVLAQLSMADSAEALVEEVRRGGAAGPWTRYYEANVRLRLGQKAEALSLLEAFLAEMPQRRAYIARDWWWEPLRPDPRFGAMVGDSTSR